MDDSQRNRNFKLQLTHRKSFGGLMYLANGPLDFGNLACLSNKQARQRKEIHHAEQDHTISFVYQSARPVEHQPDGQ